MENQNLENTKGFIILIIILVIILIITGLYMALNPQKIIKKQQKASENQSDENVVITSEEVHSLIKEITASSNPCSNYIYFTNEEVTAENIPNEVAINIVLTNLSKENNDTSFAQDVIENKLQSLFGKNYSFSYQNYSTTCSSYTYDESTLKYTIEENQTCNDSCEQTISYKIVKATQHSDYLTIILRVLFLDKQTDTINYYQDYNKNNIIKTISSSELENNSSPLQDEDYNQGSLYQLTFNLEDENYVFSNSKLIEELPE